MYNNIKKIALSGLVACLVVGFSAFTSAEKQNIVRYYKVDLATYPDADDPEGYAYYADMDRCDPIGDLCSAEWELGLNPIPTVDGTPLPTSGVTFQIGTVEAGKFE
jgi:hypothetical protein